MSNVEIIDNFDDDDYHNRVIDELIGMVTPEQQEETDIKMMMAVKISTAMRRKGWSKTQFAETMGKQVSIISKWLSGTHNFTMETLIAIQRVLDVKLLNPEKEKMPAQQTVSSKAIPIANKDLHQLTVQKNGLRIVSL